MGVTGIGKVVDTTPLSPQDFQKLMDIIQTVKYGSITLIIQDGKVIQIDKNEKLRLR